MPRELSKSVFCFLRRRTAGDRASVLFFVTAVVVVDADAALLFAIEHHFVIHRPTSQSWWTCQP